MQSKTTAMKLILTSSFMKIKGCALSVFSLNYSNFLWNHVVTWALWREYWMEVLAWDFYASCNLCDASNVISSLHVTLWVSVSDYTISIFKHVRLWDKLPSESQCHDQQEGKRKKNCTDRTASYKLAIHRWFIDVEHSRVLSQAGFDCLSVDVFSWNDLGSPFRTDGHSRLLTFACDSPKSRNL